MKEINPQYPDIEFLRTKAKKRIPGFAFEYLEGGCNSEVGLKRNTEDIRSILLEPYYLRKFKGESLKTELFGHEYDAPFGISPIGLQGLIWPKASEILARAAFVHNIPYILSTVGTSSIEEISEITEGRAWFQLYNPREDSTRIDLMKRLKDYGYKVLVILCDVPSFGYRSKEIRNGLSIPPRMTVRNMLQIMGRPSWAINTLIAGQPQFKTLTPYLPKNLSLKHLGLFMNKMFDGRLDHDRVSRIRDEWGGKLVLKGVASKEDADKAITLGLDGIIVSNHGGRQLDASQSTVNLVSGIAEKYRGRIKVMMDSGIRTGPDIANCLASGAKFTFLGRSFMYGVAALGKQGGDQTITLLKNQLRQVMQQLGCDKVDNLRDHKI